ncbi:MAG: T9SS type A sorting domain-containing protein, partial [Flavobacteriales bacterium]|nr:T9SS type A sorting domain-containing protein [Flavobacteriales bacterium]
EITVESTVYPTDPANPTAVVNLANIDLTVGGTGYTLDQNGYIITGETGTATATIPLEGTWCKIINDGSGSTPSMTVTVNDVAPNVLSYDGDAMMSERCAYNNVNRIHDYMKSILPTFTGMDWKLTTNVEITPHECNAFYNGISINFYEDNVDCYSLAMVNDVVYHEYGHGINNEFYQDAGMSFNNGGMGEGYYDVWGFAQDEDPLLGDGMDPTDPTVLVRRYDIEPKVYPNDLTGEVHADGEIIGGCWWDTYVLLGNDMPAMMNLFAIAYLGGQATNPNGAEGQAYTEVLLDCLLADDTDADISNGTPNDAAIVQAFRIHGITLISNAVLTHTPVESELPTTGIDITADLILGLPWSDYLDNVKCIYQINESGIWDTISMVNTSGNVWDGQIPAQPIGTVVAYYVGAEDINGVLSAVEPIQAHDADPNLPYYVLVGFDLEAEEDAADFVSTFGNWNTGVSDDGATTGMWELNSPVGSFGTPGDPSSMVAPDYQHTPGGSFCWVTGQSTSSSAALGANDVDAGKTTIESDPLDLSGYDNPTISYWRWYSNNPPSGANPNADWFQVYISNDGGSTWNFVEDTKVSERNWRRNVFRIQDYTTKSNNMVMRFVVSDSIRPGEYLDGGSLIESALDDIRLWDNSATSVDEIDGLSGYSLYPNPATQTVNLSFFTAFLLEDVQIEVVNNMGQVVFVTTVAHAEETVRMPLDVSSWAAGLYHVSIKYDGKVNSKILSVQK